MEVTTMPRGSSMRSSIEQKLKAIYKKNIVAFEKDVMADIKQDFQDSIDEWIEGFEKWKISKGQSSYNNFDVFYKAGSLYGNSRVPKIESDGSFGYSSTMGVGPKYLDENRVKFKSEWGDRDNKKFSNAKAFGLMYNAGIYGYNLDIVKRSWYKHEPAKKRAQIINFLRLSNVIPPDPFDTPDNIMNEKFKRIQSKDYLDKKWKKYDKAIKKELKKKH